MSKKPNFTVAFATQRASKKKKMAKGGVVGGQAPGETKAKGISDQDSNMATKSPKSPMITADEQAKSRAMLAKEHSSLMCRGESCPGCMSPECYAYGGVIGGQAPGEAEGGRAGIGRPGYGSLGSSDPMASRTSISPEEDKMQRMAKASLEDSAGYEGIADRIRKRRMMAEGGVVGKNNDDDYKFDNQDQIEHPNYYYARDEIIGNEKLYDNDYGTDPMDSNEKGDTLSDEDEHGKSMFKRIKMKKAQPGDRGDY